MVSAHKEGQVRAPLVASRMVVSLFFRAKTRRMDIEKSHKGERPAGRDIGTATVDGRADEHHPREQDTTGYNGIHTGYTTGYTKMQSSYKCDPSDDHGTKQSKMRFSIFRFQRDTHHGNKILYHEEGFNMFTCIPLDKEYFVLYPGRVSRVYPVVSR